MPSMESWRRAHRRDRDGLGIGAASGQDRRDPRITTTAAQAADSGRPRRGCRKFIIRDRQRLRRRGAGMCSAGAKLVDAGEGFARRGGAGGAGLGGPFRDAYGASGVRVRGGVRWTILSRPQGCVGSVRAAERNTPEMVQQLDAALSRCAEVVAKAIGRDVSELRTRRGGAAGGLGFGLMAFPGASLRRGVE